MAVKNDNINKVDVKDFKIEIDRYIKEKVDKGINVEEFKEEINKHVNEKIRKDLNLNEFKNEIDRYIKERVEKEAASDKVKFYKKQIRNKNILIFIMFILLIASLGGIGYGAYYLYKDGYFDKDKQVVVDNKKDDNQNKISDDSKREEDEIKTDELINKYSYLLDKINIDIKCDYINELYAGNLTTSLKEYLAYKLIDSKKIISDDTSSYFDVSDMENSYKELFNDKLVYSSFKYNGVTYKYLESKNMFISNDLSIDSINIEREIISIKEDDGKVIISTVEGYFKDKKLYNVKNNKEINEYKDGDKLSLYKKKLNTLDYVFNNGYLESIK